MILWACTFVEDGALLVPEYSCMARETCQGASVLHPLWLGGDRDLGTCMSDLGSRHTLLLTHFQRWPGSPGFVADKVYDEAARSKQFGIPKCFSDTMRRYQTPTNRLVFTRLYLTYQGSCASDPTRTEEPTRHITPTCNIVNTTMSCDSQRACVFDAPVPFACVERARRNAQNREMISGYSHMLLTHIAQT
jgi:hypothetical protein